MSFNKVLVFVVYVMAVLSLIFALSNIYSQLLRYNEIVSMNLSLVVSLIFLFGTIVNIYAILVLVLSKKDIRGIWVFFSTNLVVLLATSFIIYEYDFRQPRKKAQRFIEQVYNEHKRISKDFTEPYSVFGKAYYKENRIKLYNFANKHAGFPEEKYDEFINDIRNRKNRRSLYTLLRNRGELQQVSFEDFSTDIGFLNNEADKNSYSVSYATPEFPKVSLKDFTRYMQDKDDVKKAYHLLFQRRQSLYIGNFETFKRKVQEDYFLKSLYNETKRLRKDFTAPYSRFKKDMQDESKLKKVHDWISKQYTSLYIGGFKEFRNNVSNSLLKSNYPLLLDKNKSSQKKDDNFLRMLYNEISRLHTGFTASYTSFYWDMKDDNRLRKVYDWIIQRQAPLYIGGFDEFARLVKQEEYLKQLHNRLIGLLGTRYYISYEDFQEVMQDESGLKNVYNMITERLTVLDIDDFESFKEKTFIKPIKLSVFAKNAYPVILTIITLFVLLFLRKDKMSGWAVLIEARKAKTKVVKKTVKTEDTGEKVVVITIWVIIAVLILVAILISYDNT